MKGICGMKWVADDLLKLLKDGLNLRKVEEEKGDIVNWPKYWAEVEALTANAELRDLCGTSARAAREDMGL